MKASVSSYKGKSSERDHNASGEDKKTSTTNELLQVLREQAAWKQGQVGYARGISYPETGINAFCKVLAFMRVF